MFTVKNILPTDTIKLKGATATEKAHRIFGGEGLINAFAEQESLYADLGICDAGQYTFTLDAKHSGITFFAGYWYMESGSFEPNICKLAELETDMPTKVLYDQSEGARYYGGLCLVAEGDGCVFAGDIENALYGATLETEFLSLPKSVTNPIVIVESEGKAERKKLFGVTLRGAFDKNGEFVCDELNLRNGMILRKISPLIDFESEGEICLEKYRLPFTAREKIDLSLLPEITENCCVTSDADIAVCR